MSFARLTRSAPAATTRCMKRGNSWSPKAKWVLPVLAAGPVMLGGCVQVEAPTEPIVIELNINIQSEVLVRLAEDANSTIEENADIF